jgi:hypothetical protein
MKQMARNLTDVEDGFLIETSYLIHDPDPLPGPRRDVRRREIPLAVMMVALTTLTLWSLGQVIVVEEVATAAVPVAAADPVAAVTRPK